MRLGKLDDPHDNIIIIIMSDWSTRCPKIVTQARTIYFANNNISYVYASMYIRVVPVLVHSSPAEDPVYPKKRYQNPTNLWLVKEARSRGFCRSSMQLLRLIWGTPSVIVNQWTHRNKVGLNVNVTLFAKAVRSVMCPIMQMQIYRGILR